MSEPEIINCEQGTPEWYAARLGIPTASMYKALLASGKDGGASKTRRTYLCKLAGEVITGECMENFQNAAMQRGHEMEDEARRLYAMMKDVDPVQVGFVRNGNTGCSPDSLVGDRGMLEIKTEAPHLLIETLLAGTFPMEHRAQCQGNLWVAKREWIDIAIFYRKMPLFVSRANRDEGYIATISGAVRTFNEELAQMVEKIRRFG